MTFAAARRPPRAVTGAGVSLALVVVLTALFAVVGPARPASAHATLQSTDPLADRLIQAVPESVRLVFDEPVSTSTGSVQVIGPDGSRADGGVETEDGGRTVRVRTSGAAEGTYTVAYRVVSDDGHTIAGSFVFHVRIRTGAAEIDQSVPVLTSAAGGLGRWLSYAGAVVAVGAAAMLVLARSHGGPGRALGRLAAMIAGGAAVAGLGADLAVLAQTATTTGRSLVASASLVPEVAADSRPVAVALARASVLLAAALIAVIGRRRPAALIAAGGLAAAAGLLAPIAGHPWTADPRALAVPADGLHLVAASVWIGLLAVLATSADFLRDPERAARQVSSVALGGAAVVLVTGAVSSWLLLGSLDALLRTASGQLVILKVIGFVALVLLGWFNRSRLIPLLAPSSSGPASATAAADEGARVEGGDPTSEPTDPPAADAGVRAAAMRRLVTSVRAEVVVAALVLAVTAGLVNQPPGRDVVDRPFSEVVTVDGVSMLLEVRPGKAGANEMHMYVTDADGRPSSVDALEMKVSTDQIPERRAATEQLTPDHAVAYGVSMPNPGEWTVRITTVRLGAPTEFVFEVPIR